MQISLTAGKLKQDAKEAIGKSQESGNDRIVRDADSGRARAQITQKHKDMTGEHECMNWQNLGMSNNDNQQVRWQIIKNNKDTEHKQKQDRYIQIMTLSSGARVPYPSF